MKSFTSHQVKVHKSDKDNSLLFKSRPIVRYGCLSVAQTKVLFGIKVLPNVHANLKKSKIEKREINEVNSIKNGILILFNFNFNSETVCLFAST